MCDNHHRRALTCADLWEARLTTVFFPRLLPWLFLLKQENWVQVGLLLSCVPLFATPWTAAHQASLSFTVSQSLLKLMSSELVMPSNHLILCHPLLLLPSIFPSIRVFSNKLALRIRWPTYWSFSFSLSKWIFRLSCSVLCKPQRRIFPLNGQLLEERCNLDSVLYPPGPRHGSVHRSVS